MKIDKIEKHLEEVSEGTDFSFTEEEKNENWGEEICPYCDHVNDFVWEEGTKRTIICKNCGKEILLCSLCDMDRVCCSKCPYDNREE